MGERIPPYEYEYVWTRIDGTGSDIRIPGLIPASKQNGRAEFLILANGGRVETHRGVGIFFRPPTRNGLLTLSSNPSYRSDYVNEGFFHGALTRVWLGFVIESFNASDNFFDRGLVTQREMIYDRDIAWWSGGERRFFSSEGFPITTQVRVDSNHWYKIWVLCGGVTRSAGKPWSFALEGFDMNVSRIIWSYSTIA